MTENVCIYVYAHGHAYMYRCSRWNVDFLYRRLKSHKFSFCALIWKLDMHRRAEGVRPEGVQWRPRLLSHLFLIWDVTRVIVSIYHNRKQAAEEERLEAPRDKDGTGMPMAMTLNIDQMTCLFLGWCQNIQCFNLVIAKFSSPLCTTRWELQGQPVSAGEKSSNAWEGK